MSTGVEVFLNIVMRINISNISDVVNLIQHEQNRCEKID